MTKIIILAILTAVCVTGAKAQDYPEAHSSDLVKQAPGGTLRTFAVWDTVPAKNWMEAYPVGNGRQGAMPFGDYPNERILINDKTVWLGRSGVVTPPTNAAQTLKEIREALFQDDFRESETLLNSKLLPPRPEHMDFQPIGYLHLNYDLEGKGGKCHDYRRTLVLNDAVAVTEFTTEDGNQIRQEVIASHPADVIAIRVESRNGKKLSLGVGMDRFKYFKTELLDAQTLGMSGVAQVDGKSVGTAWQAVAHMLAEGGTTTSKTNQIVVIGASAITILVTTSTDYDINNPMVPLRHDRLQACLQALKKRFGPCHTHSSKPKTSKTTGPISSGQQWTSAPPPQRWRRKARRSASTWSARVEKTPT